MSIRPVFRVASAGLDPRDVRLIGIVFQHSQYNKYDFRMLEGLDLAGIDILIANPVDPRGLDAIASLPGASRRIPSLSAVPRGAQATARPGRCLPAQPGHCLHAPTPPRAGSPARAVPPPPGG